MLFAPMLFVKVTLYSVASGLSVMGDCECSYTGVAFCEKLFYHSVKTNKVKYIKICTILTREIHKELYF